MLRQPRLVLLDEPEVGVDIGGEQTLYQVLAQLVEARQRTVLITRMNSIKFGRDLVGKPKDGHTSLCFSRRQGQHRCALRKT